MATPAVQHEARRRIAEADRVLVRLGVLADPMLDEHRYTAWLDKGEALGELERHAEAVATYDEIIAHVDAASGGRALWLARALTGKGLALRQLGDHWQELATYDELFRRLDGATTQDVRVWIARATFLRIETMEQHDDHVSLADVAREYEQLIERFAADTPLTTRTTAATARLRHLLKLGESGQAERALDAYPLLIAEFTAAPEPSIHALAVLGERDYSALLRKLDHHAEALAVIDAAGSHLHAPADEVSTGLRAEIDAQRIELLHDAGRFDATLAACNDMLRSHVGQRGLDVLWSVCKVLRIKAAVLLALRRRPEALGTLARIADECDDLDHAGLREQVTLALSERLHLLAGSAPTQQLQASTVLLDRLDRYAHEPAVATALAGAWLHRARLQRQSGNASEAVATFDVLVTRFDRVMDERMVRLVARARLGKALALADLKRHDDELTEYAELAARFDESAVDELRILAARARRRCSEGLQGNAQRTERKRMIAELTAQFGADNHPRVRAQVAGALCDFVASLRQWEEYKTALALCLRVKALYEDDPFEPVRQAVHGCLLHAGRLFGEHLQRPHEALASYDELLVRIGDPVNDRQRDLILAAEVGRAACLDQMEPQEHETVMPAELPAIVSDMLHARMDAGQRMVRAGEHRAAIAQFDQVIEQHADAIHPELARQCARAFFNKAGSLDALARHDAAIACLDEIDRRYGTMPATQEQVAIALAYKAIGLEKLGRGVDALAVYEVSLQRYAQSPETSLRQRAAMAGFLKGDTLLTLGRIDAAMDAYRQVIERQQHDSEPELQVYAAKAMNRRAEHFGRTLQFDAQVAECQALIEQFRGNQNGILRGNVLKASLMQADAHAALGHPGEQIALIETALGDYADHMTAAQRAELQARLLELQQPMPTKPGMAGRMSRALGRKKRDRP